ncbi:MAG: ParB/RepB/Spo0J family partition protein [Alphaproteobacteria bacterium]|nr:ParB/RepB/Spo0J family partition protein [Alphaproteobacteria bacterium]
MKKKANEGRGLGRGLSALFGDEENDNNEAQGSNNAGSRRMMPVEWLTPNPDQPRRIFTKEALAELSDSIRQHGMIQPILVRPIPEAGNRYQIVAGERRWRAAQVAQLHEVPVTIQYLTDEAVLELGLIENLQREDLTPLEEAEAYQQLMSRFGHTQEKIAQAMGKSRSYVANMVRLLNLPETVKGYMREGKLSAGHARTLVTADDPLALAKAMVEGGMTVREAEALTATKKGKPAKGKVKKAGPAKDADTEALEREITNALGMPVGIKAVGKGGVVTINYASLDQLDDVLRRLSKR